jgi:hypothetical protein
MDNEALKPWRSAGYFQESQSGSMRHVSTVVNPFKLSCVTASSKMKTLLVFVGISIFLYVSGQRIGLLLEAAFISSGRKIM